LGEKKTVQEDGQWGKVWCLTGERAKTLGGPNATVKNGKRNPSLQKSVNVYADGKKNKSWKKKPET